MKINAKKIETLGKMLIRCNLLSGEKGGGGRDNLLISDGEGKKDELPRATSFHHNVIFPLNILVTNWMIFRSWF